MGACVVIGWGFGGRCPPSIFFALGYCVISLLCGIIASYSKG